MHVEKTLSSEQMWLEQPLILQGSIAVPHSTLETLRTISERCVSISMLFCHLLPAHWSECIPLWFAEGILVIFYNGINAADTPSFDYGGFVVGDGEMEAHLYQKAKVPSLFNPER